MELLNMDLLYSCNDFMKLFLDLLNWSMELLCGFDLSKYLMELFFLNNLLWNYFMELHYIYDYFMDLLYGMTSWCCWCLLWSAWRGQPEQDSGVRMMIVMNWTIRLGLVNVLIFVDENKTSCVLFSALWANMGQGGVRW